MNFRLTEKKNLTLDPVVEHENDQKSTQQNPSTLWFYPWTALAMPKAAAEAIAPIRAVCKALLMG